MALTKCKECKREIAKSAKTCPYCGIQSPGSPVGFIGIILVAFLVFFIYSLAMPENATQNTTPQQIANEIEQKKTADKTAKDFIHKILNIVQTNPKWESIEITKMTANHIALTIWYKQSPTGFPEVERDSKMIARAALKVLIDSGINPISNGVFVFVWSEGRTKGETGKDLVSIYGKTTYNYLTDQLEFEIPDTTKSGLEFKKYLSNTDRYINNASESEINKKPPVKIYQNTDANGVSSYSDRPASEP